MNQKQSCSNCGSLNALQNLFCDQCGAQLSLAKPSTSNIESSKTCPQCGAKNPSTANNCVQCGANLATGAHSTYSSQTSGSTAFFATRVDKLGNRLDGWADLIDNAADKADAVRSTFEADIERRDMPQVGHSQPTLTPGGLAGKRRSYQLAQSYTGATLAVYIGEFGRDLYVSWDLFLRPHIKWRNILIMLGAAAVLAIFPAIDAYSKFARWFTGTIGGFIGIVILALFLGKVLRGSAKAFFMEEIDHFAADDVTATMFAVHHGLLKAIDEVGLDSSLLREKETFKAGRRERII